MEPSLLALGLGTALFWAVTLIRAHRRERKVAADWPPEGQMVTLGGVPMHVVTQGTGPDVVLIHGASGSVRDFTFRLLPELASRYRVHAVDRPGLGHSGACLASEQLAVQAQMVRQAAAVMGAARPIVVGHSYGGAVALRWAVDAPTTLAGLVLVAPVAFPWEGGLPLYYRLTATPVLRAVVNPLIAAWTPSPTVNRAVAEVFAPDPVPEGYLRHFGPRMAIRRRTLRHNGEQRRVLKDEIAALATQYGRITAPVEILHGDNDATVGLDHHARPLLGAVPDATLTVLRGHGHMPHHPGVEAVIASVDRIASRPGPAKAETAPGRAAAPAAGVIRAPIPFPRTGTGRSG